MEERELADDEREELQEAASRALEKLGVGVEDLSAVLEAVEQRIVARRVVKGSRDEEAFELGALVGAIYEMGLGWELVERSWPTGLVALAVCEMDRSLAILPFLAVSALFDATGEVPALRSTFDRLATGERPPGLTRGTVAVLLP